MEPYCKVLPNPFVTLYILNVLTVTFDQINTFLLNKCINYLNFLELIQELNGHASRFPQKCSAATLIRNVSWAANRHIRKTLAKPVWHLITEMLDKGYLIWTSGHTALCSLVWWDSLFGECLYQHNINCPEPTGRLRYRVELLHPALRCRPCWSFKSAQSWRMRQTERRERKKYSLLIRFCLPSLRRQQSKRGAFSYSWVGGEWQWIKEPCVCVCVYQCVYSAP